VCDAYGLTRTKRQMLIAELDEAIRRGGEFVLRRVEQGDPNFISMWSQIGGMTRYDRRRQLVASGTRRLRDRAAIGSSDCAAAPSRETALPRPLSEARNGTSCAPGRCCVGDLPDKGRP